jgi:hypothetical protein
MIRNILIAPERREGKTDTGALGVRAGKIWRESRWDNRRLPGGVLRESLVPSFRQCAATGNSAHLPQTVLAQPHVEVGITARNWNFVKHPKNSLR